jgi:hypothetical protein
MPRSRIVHPPLARRAKRPVVSAPLESATPIAAETGLSDVAVSRPAPIAVNAAPRLRRVQLDNVHPLRLRLLLEIDRTWSICRG